MHADIVEAGGSLISPTRGSRLVWAGAGLSLATAPMLLWPIRGVALGAATYAYHLRRRGACRRRGRG